MLLIFTDSVRIAAICFAVPTGNSWQDDRPVTGPAHEQNQMSVIAARRGQTAFGLHRFLA